MQNKTTFQDIADHEIDEAIARFVLRILNPRAMWVVFIYISALLMSGVPVWKTALFAMAVWLLMVLPLGRNYVEKVGGIWFFAALIAWLDIPAINRLVDSIGTKISAFI